jgi:hypothetical protein
MEWELPMADLLTAAADLPEGFDYSAEFVRVVELGLTNLEPWWIFDGDLLRRRAIGPHELVRPPATGRHISPDTDLLVCRVGS